MADTQLPRLLGKLIIFRTWACPGSLVPLDTTPYYITAYLPR